MATYPLPESISDTHDDDEWAIAAILNGRVVALHYLADVAPEIVGQNIPETESAIRERFGQSPREVTELQALGKVHAGIVTGDGFESKWKLAEWDPSDQLPEGD